MLSLPTKNEIHLWTLPHGEGDGTVLSPDEKGRLRRYHRRSDQKRYCLTQSAKRKILAKYLKQAPSDLVFQVNKYGKPSLAGCEFSLSHTTDLSILAITTGQSIGADIETIIPQDDLPALARRIMSDSEWAAYSALSKPEQLPDFYRLWTAKEAYLKNIGIGFEIEPDKVETDYPQLTTAKAKEHPPLLLLETRTSDKYCVHLASESPIEVIDCIDF